MYWIPLASSGNPILDVFDAALSHEQIFFTDNYSNIGFFAPSPPNADIWGGQPGHLAEDDPSHLGEYHKMPGNYNCCILHVAVDTTPLRKNYCLLFRGQYNCQSWADDVRAKYRELRKDPDILKKCCKYGLFGEPR